jgi:hypothetical protein
LHNKTTRATLLDTNAAVVLTHASTLRMGYGWLFILIEQRF